MVRKDVVHLCFSGRCHVICILNNIEALPGKSRDFSNFPSGKYLPEKQAGSRDPGFPGSRDENPTTTPRAY